ncbi:chemotaxis protein CheD [Spirochaetota bacterium]
MIPEVLQNRQNVYLKPGEIFWGNHNFSISTVLGSCIAICLWHPLKKIGGMCHIMMPEKGNTGDIKPNPRYADDAVRILLEKIAENKTKPFEYVVKVFGGSSMIKFENDNPEINVAKLNIKSAKKLMMEHGFRISVKDVGGSDSRKIVFDLNNGDAWKKKVRANL